MSESDCEIRVEHITPHQDSLSTINTNVLCEKEGCNRTFKSLSVLTFHQAQFHDHQKVSKKVKRDGHIEERFHCPIKDCIYYYTSITFSRYFAKLQYLKQHYLKVHSTCSHPCQRCSKSFSTRSFLRAHEQYCDLNLVCSCEQKFGSITSIQTHVKRTGHHADVLAIYYSRIYEKKCKKSDEAKFPPSARYAPSSSSSFSSSFSSSSSSSVTSTILPKSEPPHLIAAIALSELAFTGLKRVATAEVGVQTDKPATKRWSRKCTSPFRSRESSKESESHKRKLTTEMETQTRLTHLKSKMKKKGTAKRVSKCHIATDTQPASHPIPTTHSDILKFSLEESNITPETETTYNTEYEPRNGFPSHLTYERSLAHNLNTSGTQTGSSGLSFDMVSGNEDECLSYDMYLDGGSKEASCHRSDNETFDDEMSLNVNATTHQRITSDRLDSSQIIIDEDDNLMSMSPSGRLSPLLSRRPPSLSSQIRSSSIETQTEHDVFLSTHVQTLDDADDIILTSTQTQTQTQTQLERSPPSSWCTSETQTCEDFSDIEPYLCSTIHTQTVGEDHSSSELFPELNNFTVDMQTQTRLDDAPTRVTTHTQTSTSNATLLPN